jgi:hypothetical protein
MRSFVHIIGKMLHLVGTNGGKVERTMRTVHGSIALVDVVE